MGRRSCRCRRRCSGLRRCGGRGRARRLVFRRHRAQEAVQQRVEALVEALVGSVSLATLIIESSVCENGSDTEPIAPTPTLAELLAFFIA